MLQTPLSSALIPKNGATEVMDLNKDKKWNSLKAVRTQKTYVVNANSYFSKPSTRIVTGIEILAKILHPDLFEELKME